MTRTNALVRFSFLLGVVGSCGLLFGCDEKEKRTNSSNRYDDADDEDDDDDDDVKTARSKAAAPGAMAVAAIAPAPLAPAALPIPAPPPQQCTSMRVQSARDARGAPFWSNLFDLKNNGGRVGAPMHVLVGGAIHASCRSNASGQGFGVCAKDADGNVGWLHHDRLLSNDDPAGALRTIQSLPVCANDSCDAAQCG